MSRVGKWLVRGSYGLFLSLYVYVAAAYGLTRVSELGPFECAVGAIMLIWLAGHSLQRRLPRIGIWPFVLVLMILGFGWFITGLGWLNDVVVDADIPNWAGKLIPDLAIDWGTYDTEASVHAMLRTTALLASMLMAIDFWREPNRARGIVLTIVFSSFVMVLFFFLQRIVGAPFILMSEDGKAPLAFATYRYHGNAAAYLNLSWPITAGVAIFAVVRQNMAWPFWFIPLAATLVATFLNVSKAGNVLAPIGVILLLLILFPYLTHEIKRSNRRIRKSRILVALVPVIIIITSIPFALPWKRWDYLAKNPDQPGGRLDAYAEFVKMIPEAGASGFGPGTFPIYSFVYTSKATNLKKYWYEAAHEDYIQTVIEWGYIGTSLWALLIIPPLIPLFKTARTSRRKNSSEFEGYRIGVVDHVKAFFKTVPAPQEACIAAGTLTAVMLTAIHALFDFPMQIASLQFYFLTLLALGWSYRVTDRTLAMESVTNL